MENILTVENLSIKEGGHAAHKPLVKDASLGLHTFRPLSLIGESGCGKTLVGQAITGLVPKGLKVTGEIIFNGQDILSCGGNIRSLWGRELFLFPQEPAKYLNPLVPGLNQISEVFRELHGNSGKRSRFRSGRMMGRVRLRREDGRKYPWQLSGGMAQRLLTAIAMAEPAKVIVADEPTKGLDNEMKYQMVALLKSLSDSGKALLVITHDLEVPELLGGDMAVMYGGRILETGTAEAVLQKGSHPYTLALQNALPKNGLIPIPRGLNHGAGDGGCVFYRRCCFASAGCTQHPQCRRLGRDNNHMVACHSC